MGTKLNIKNSDSLSKSSVSSSLFSNQNAFIGRIVTWTVSSLIIINLFTLILGLISLKSPDESIGNPYFSILELLIIILTFVKLPFPALEYN